MRDVDCEIAACSRCAPCRFPDGRLAADSSGSGDCCCFIPMRSVAGEDGRMLATVVPADGAADDIHHRFEVVDRQRTG